MSSHQSPYFSNYSKSKLLAICPRSKPHQSQSHFLQRRGRLTTSTPWCRCCRQPLSAYDQSVAIAAPWSFPASQSTSEDEWTSGALILGGPVRLHLLPWHCNSFLDRFSMAGSQFLYLPTHSIELSLPVVGAHNMESRQRESKEEKVDVKIVYLYGSSATVPLDVLIAA